MNINIQEIMEKGKLSDVLAGQPYGWLLPNGSHLSNIDVARKLLNNDTVYLCKLKPVNVICDNCSEQNLTKCYNYENQDICLKCAQKSDIKKSLKPLRRVHTLMLSTRTTGTAHPPMKSTITTAHAQMESSRTKSKDQTYMVSSRTNPYTTFTFMESSRTEPKPFHESGGPAPFYESSGTFHLGASTNMESLRTSPFGVSANMESYRTKPSPYTNLG